jgi:hypothetical protein
MWNVKNKLFEDYVQERLTVVHMALILLLRVIGYICMAFFIVCLFIGVIPVLLLTPVQSFLKVLFKRFNWKRCKAWQKVMRHEIDNRIHRIIWILSM